MIILIVEDEALIAMALEADLNDAGYEVLGPASTVGRALELAEATPPDLALVDINLRGGGSGIEVARELLERWDAPSLFVSGQRLDAHRNKDAAIGYLGKPYSPQAVIASIEAASCILKGSPPDYVPPGLELFNDRPEGKGAGQIRH